MRFGVFTPWKICTNITQGPALGSGGRACLDPGTFIFTNLLREGEGEVSKKLQIFWRRGLRELRDKANASDLNIPFTPPPSFDPHPLCKEVPLAPALRVSDLVFFQEIKRLASRSIATAHFPTKNCRSLELPQTACLTRYASLRASSSPISRGAACDGSE